MDDFDWEFLYPSQRMPVLARNVVATSQPLAAEAGLHAISKGGNAVDAAVATAIALALLVILLLLRLCGPGSGLLGEVSGLPEPTRLAHKLSARAEGPFIRVGFQPCATALISLLWAFDFDGITFLLC